MRLEDVAIGSTELDIKDSMEKNPYDEGKKLLTTCLSKIAIGKTIKIRGTDAFTLFYNYIYGNIPHGIFNKELFSKKSLYTVDEICRELSAKNFSITQKLIQLGPNKSNYFIEAIRNE